MNNDVYVCMADAMRQKKESDCEQQQWDRFVKEKLLSYAVRINEQL